MNQIRYKNKHMGKVNILKGVCFVVLAASHFSAHAMGYGFYTTAITTGNTQWSSSGNPDFETGFDRRELGLMLDTAVAKDKLFNYRLQVAYVETTYNAVKYTGGAVTNTFGFGIVRNRDMRIWIGPQIGIRKGGIQYQNRLNFATEIGVAAGLNYHINPSLSLTGETGVRNGIAYEYNLEGKDSSELAERSVFINIGMLYRFNDNF